MAKPNRPGKGEARFTKLSKNRPSGSPDGYVAHGRAVSSQNPSKGGNAFSAYGLSEKMKRGAQRAADGE